MNFANVITDQLANIFQKRGAVEPGELIKALEREISKKKSKDNLVPNVYTIYLCEDDCYRLNAARLLKVLHESVERKIIREDCFMDGNLSIKLKKTAADGDAAIVIASDYVVEVAPEENTINLENDVLSQTLIENLSTGDEESTIIADKTRIVKTMRTAAPRKVIYDLAVISDMQSQEIILGERQVHFGRKRSNDFVLADESVSRIHAYISYERHRHVLYDAGSLNGTHVNGKAISRHELRDGDKIQMGNTTLIYKVL